MENGLVSKRFHLLQPKVCPPRLDRLSVITGVQDPTELDWIISEHPAGELLALDFETQGNEPANPLHKPVGVAFADSRGSCYIDFLSSPGAYGHLMQLLHRHRTPLCSHNVFFDSAWPLRDFDLWLNWTVCTLAVYRLTASEGFFGQRWGLKDAQIDMLGWSETNEESLDRWLIEHGYVKNISKQSKGGYYLYPDWKIQKKTEPRYVAPDKGEMWRAPAEILGHYACLDADSCWLLWAEVLKPCVDRFTFLRQEYIYDWYPRYLRVLVEQKLHGIEINRDGVVSYLGQVEAEFADAVQAFYRLPGVDSFLAQANEKARAAERAAEPHKWNKVKERAEPPQFLKDGVTLSKNWLKWKEWKDSDASNPKLNQNWTKWRARMDEVESKDHLNLNSPVQVRELLYEHLGLPVEVWTKPSKTAPDGMPSTGKTALLAMGDVGKALLEIKDREKIRQFCEQLLSLLIEHEDGTWTVHPGFMVPGTLTGRLSGKSPNVQQVPKDGFFLRNFVPRAGCTFVDCDHVAVEPVVMTELSKDPGLRKIYGPDAKPNCIYLYTGWHYPNELGDKIRAAGYDPDGMDAETLEHVKKSCKPERKASKRCYLAWGYGAGAPKLQFGFKMDGYLFPLEQVQDVRDAIDGAFPELGPWGKELERQWRKNKGWLFNGVGRPLAVSADKLKDLKNRVVQSTAHDAHIKYILIVMDLLERDGIPWWPIIVDFHDQMIVECRVEDAERVKYLMGTEAYVHLNDWLGGEIKVKGDPQIVPTLAHAKVEKWAEKEAEEEMKQLEEEEVVRGA